RRWWWWAGVCVVAVALPMSVAKTAILGAVIAVSIAFWSWPKHVRTRVLLLSPFALIAMRSAVPGLLGTIKSLFINAGSDPSTAGRTDDYAPVWQYVSQAPLTGRGVGTFIPSLYRTLDNQYLGILVEAGVLGLVSLLALLGGGVVAALLLGRRAPLAEDRSLAVALAAGLAVPLVTFVTFDGLAFPMAAGMTFLLLGATSALWRLERGKRALSTAPASRRDWVPRAVTAAALAALLLEPYQVWLLTQHTRYRADAAILIEIPQPQGVNPYLKAGRAELATGVLRLVLDGPQARDRLREAVPDADYGIAVGNGSLERGTDVVKSASSLTLRVTSRSPARAEALRSAFLEEMQSELRRLQEQAGVPASVQLVARPLGQPAVQQVQGSLSRGAVAMVLVWGLVACAVASRLRRRAGTPSPTPSATPPVTTPAREPVDLEV
ncbi:MAG TPA: O-antigen ligase family protein, partial [Actinomycetales bacterium]